MNKEKNIDIIIEELLKNGSSIDYLSELKSKSLEIAKKDIGYYEEDKTKIEIIGTYKDENNNLIKLENSSYFVYPKYLKCN